MLSFGAPAEKAREAQLMVQEKVDAAIEGALAAQAAWGAFLLKAAFGGVRTANDDLHGVWPVSPRPRPSRRGARCAPTRVA